MSGAVAAHAAYNGSGTQGLAVTNKIHDDDGDVMSVFWNKNDTTRQLLYGSSVIEIPSSGAQTLNFGQSRLFTVNSDIDCLGDMYLQIDAKFPKYSSYTAATGVGKTGLGVTLAAEPFALQSIIDRVEIQVGTQIWQTLEKDDIRVVNATEMTPDAFAETAKLSSPGSLADPVTTRAWLVLPSLTKTLGPRLGKFSNQTEDGYPMAAAPHQSVKVKVTFVETPPSKLTWKGYKTAVDTDKTYPVVIQEDVPFTATLDLSDGSGSFDANSLSGTLVSAIGASAGDAATITSCLLFAKQQIMCNEEREQIKAMPMGLPKRLKMTQNSYTSDLGSGATKTIELDHFSLYTSHLIIAGDAGLDSSGDPIKLKTAELKLNSSSYSGQLPGVLLESCTADSLGVYANKYIYGDNATSSTADFTATIAVDASGTYNLTGLTADGSAATTGGNFTPGKAYNITFGELGTTVTTDPVATVTANSSGNFSGQTVTISTAGVFSQSTPGTITATITDTVAVISVKEFGMGTYIFPLAATAFSGSCVPLNRFDSIRLTLTFTSGPSAGSDTYVNVTCVGETTALFKGGAASLAMY